MVPKNYGIIREYSPMPTPWTFSNRQILVILRDFKVICFLEPPPNHEKKIYSIEMNIKHFIGLFREANLKERRRERKMKMYLVFLICRWLKSVFYFVLHFHVGVFYFSSQCLFNVSFNSDKNNMYTDWKLWFKSHNNFSIETCIRLEFCQLFSIETYIGLDFCQF